LWEFHLANEKQNNKQMKIEELGKLLKHRRMVLRLTISDLAALTGMSKTTISQIERGFSNPTFEVLQNIIEYLNLEMKVEVKKHN
jgi:transcriptional regulator with XRE-family HTH domain